MAKYEMRRPETLNEILNRYNPEGDCGAYGKRFEVMFRATLTDKVERVHPAGYADCSVKRGVSVECKSGAGALDTFGWDTKEEAELAMENMDFLHKCSHVAYLPKFNGENLEDTIIVPRKRFIRILLKYNLVRVRKGSDGKWYVTIQNYLPTEKFKPSKERVGCLIEDLQDNGYYIDIFAERMLNKELEL